MLDASLVGDLPEVVVAFAQVQLEIVWVDDLVAKRFRCQTCVTAASLVERVLPEVNLRQWVLRLFVDTVHDFYTQRAAAHGGGSAIDAKTGAVAVVQRTSSDLRLNPHLHVVFLDGAF